MSPLALRLLCNLYPPFLGAGIRVARVSDDFRRLTVRMPLRFYNRNFVGTHFGGSLFTMTDPFLMLMLIQILGSDYIVWDKAAEIEYVAPGRGAVTAEFVVTDQDIAEIHERTADGGKCLRWFDLAVVHGDGSVVARVRRQIYVRRRSARAEPVSAR